MTATCQVLVPDLLGPLPAQAREWEALRRPYSALELLLARGSRQPGAGSGLYRRIQDLFKLEPAAAELPAGALGLLGEGGTPGDACWLRADPVHLRPDRDRLMLFADRSGAPTADEAQALMADCNRLLAQDGLELRLGPRGGWYLRSDSPIALRTVPTAEVAGRYLDDYLPRGDDARRWLSLMTELQMVLHASAVNVQREGRGEPSINGLWLWGAGALPTAARAPWDGVLAEDSTLRGAALQAGARLPDNRAAALAAGGVQLMALETLSEALAEGDMAGWSAALAGLERDYLAPLLERLRAGQVEQLALDTGDWRWTLTARQLRRFWRRPRRLLHDVEFGGA